MYDKRELSQVRDAINWNALEREDTQLFWNQGIRQFWIDEEIPLADDKLTWGSLDDKEKLAYKRIIAGLTLLDTEQGALGTPSLMNGISDLGVKSVLAYFTFMEHMHAKSYSSIFSTLCSTKEIDDLFTWVKDNEMVQNKISIIAEYYYNIEDDISLYKAMVCSVMLENFLFYSGFFYPLYMAGHGKLVSSGEIINLIVRDEVIHGTYISKLAIDLYNTFSIKVKAELKQFTINLLMDLYKNEVKYADYIYKDIGLYDDVLTYIAYNANRTMVGLGFDKPFDINESDVNAIVLSGLDTKTKNHDFFSTKGNGYIKATNIEELDDNDFDF